MVGRYHGSGRVILNSEWMMEKNMTSEQFTIRRKVIKFFGGSFRILDSAGQVVGYCRQKAFKLKEDLRIYTGEDCSNELLLIKARNIIDFGATYSILLPDGIEIGSVRRKGLMSTFARDSWKVFDGDGNEIGMVSEDTAGMAFARRFIPLVTLFSPQKFELRRIGSDESIATFRTHSNIFVRRLGIRIWKEDPFLSEPMILSIGCLLTAMESRTER